MIQYGIFYPSQIISKIFQYLDTSNKLHHVFDRPYVVVNLSLSLKSQMFILSSWTFSLYTLQMILYLLW